MVTYRIPIEGMTCKYWPAVVAQSFAPETVSRKATRWRDQRRDDANGARVERARTCREPRTRVAAPYSNGRGGWVAQWIRPSSCDVATGFSAACSRSGEPRTDVDPRLLRPLLSWVGVRHPQAADQPHRHKSHARSKSRIGDRRVSVCTYSNGRGERSQAGADDLSVQLALSFEVLGRDRWSVPAA